MPVIFGHVALFTNMHKNALPWSAGKLTSLNPLFVTVYTLSTVMVA